MLFQINHLGKVEHATIELDGLTLLVGTNNSGKSTISKALFATYNGFSNTKQVLQADLYYTLEMFTQKRN